MESAGVQAQWCPMLETLSTACLAFLGPGLPAGERLQRRGHEGLRYSGVGWWPSEPQSEWGCSMWAEVGCDGGRGLEQ
jgi:hypothetical protein